MDAIDCDGGRNAMINIKSKDKELIDKIRNVCSLEIIGKFTIETSYNHSVFGITLKKPETFLKEKNLRLIFNTVADFYEIKLPVNFFNFLDNLDED